MLSHGVDISKSYQRQGLRDDLILDRDLPQVRHQNLEAPLVPGNHQDRGLHHAVQVNFEVGLGLFALRAGRGRGASGDVVTGACTPTVQTPVVTYADTTASISGRTAPEKI